MSGLLANKAQTVDEWDQVQNSIGYALERDPSVETMMRILSLSYFDLHHDLRTCLLYLSIFPEDYAIEKNRLIRRWIAEGFIHAKSGNTLYELGERCFNELINRSLIQPAHIDLYGEVQTCHVHDTILDFTVYKSIEENFVTLLGVPNCIVGLQGKVRRLSLQYNCEGNAILTKDLILSHIRSITVFGHFMEIPSAVNSRFLRVLDLQDYNVVPAHHLGNIGNLFELKYLSFKNTSLRKLPEQIGELKNLETLNLDGTMITELPATVVRLQRLVHLLIDRGIKFPDGIGNMRALEELKVIYLFMKSSRLSLEISLLTNMRDLSICLNAPVGNPCSPLRKRKRNPILSDVGLFDQPTWNNVISSICKLGTCNLRSLSIDINCGREYVFFPEWWHPAPCSLQKLVIAGFIMNVPSWVGLLVNLQKLEINVGEVGQDDIRILGGLPALHYLSVCLGLTGRVHAEISSTSGFTCLRHFHIGGNQCGLGLMFEPGSMPKLEELVLEFDAFETGHLCNLDFAFGVEHLLSLTNIRCDISSLGEIMPPSKAVMVAMERVVSVHPNHPKLTINILG